VELKRQLLPDATTVTWFQLSNITARGQSEAQH